MKNLASVNREQIELRTGKLKMKIKKKNLFLIAALIASLSLIPGGSVTAQTFTTLHSFTATDGVAGTNSDGAFPYASLITNSSGNTLYGTAAGGGRAVAQCSPSTPAAPGLQSCIVSRQGVFILIRPTATELIRLPA